jgi:cytochrome c-type biogenesis protein CcmF
VDANKPKQENKEETLLITASIKPFINVLWIGTAILVIGFFVSLIRRGRELKTRVS